LDKLKSDAKNVFRNVEISPKKLARVGVIDRASVTVEPVGVVGMGRISPRIKESLKTLMASDKGSQLLLDASARMKSLAKPSKKSGVFGSRGGSMSV